MAQIQYESAEHSPKQVITKKIERKKRKKKKKLKRNVKKKKKKKKKYNFEISTADAAKSDAYVKSHFLKNVNFRMVLIKGPITNISTNFALVPA